MVRAAELFNNRPRYVIETYHKGSLPLECEGVRVSPPQVITSAFKRGEDQVGYVVRRHPDRENLIRYHDQSGGMGRVPKLQEWFSLVGDSPRSDSVAGDGWSCIVTFLNQQAAETAESATRVRFEVRDEVATCVCGDEIVRADFASFATQISSRPD